jgi:hypothetical protein
MEPRSTSDVVKRRVHRAAHSLGTASPVPYLGELIDRSFPAPLGEDRYAANALAPGSVPVEPTFTEERPEVLRLTIEPVGLGSPLSQRHEATREMRRLVGPLFGPEALAWFDRRSESWRGQSALWGLEFGAWLGTAFDSQGLFSSEVVYELGKEQLDALPAALRVLIATAREAVPALVPVLTTIACRRDAGSQRVTFLHRGPLRLTDLEPLLRRLGLGHQLPGLMRVVGLALGGRFELPEGSVLVGLGESPDGVEVKLDILLGAVPDIPASFLDLLALGLAERPRELRALTQWLRAFTPESEQQPGEFSVLTVVTTAAMPARVNLHLRPVEFEISRQFARRPERRADALAAGR